MPPVSEKNENSKKLMVSFQAKAEHDNQLHLKKDFIMNLKVKIFILFPEIVKKAITLTYIPYRRVVESLYASAFARFGEEMESGLRIVYLTGFPRTGTTALKYYFGAYPGLEINSFDPAGFFKAWKKVRKVKPSNILVDKSNHYIKSPGTIFKACRESAVMCCIVRDPRDSLLSLLSFSEAREVPRDSRFWAYWYKNYSNFLNFAENSPYGSRIYFLRYEDFVSQPALAKSDYITWLGLDASIEKIDSTYSLPQKREFVEDKVHKRKTITTDSLQRWKKKNIDNITEKLLLGWQSNYQVKALMAKLGYEEDGLRPPKIRPKNFRMFTPND